MLRLTVKGSSRATVWGFFQLLLLAGHETTTNLIANAVLCLHDQPDQLELLRLHPELCSSGIEEVLRFRTPYQMMFRMARREVELGGQWIPLSSILIAVSCPRSRETPC